MGHYKFYCFPGRVTFFNKKYKGRAGRFYIHAHRDSSGPPPLLKNECSLSTFHGQPTILKGSVYYLVHINGGVRATRPLESSPHVRNVPANLHFSVSTIFDPTVRG